jgi:hypothetical protein
MQEAPTRGGSQLQLYFIALGLISRSTALDLVYARTRFVGGRRHRKLMDM